MTKTIVCADCGSEHVYEWKGVMLRGQMWLVRQDGYRFYLKPAAGNPAVDRDEITMLEFKHDDGPAGELAELLFSLLD